MTRAAVLILALNLAASPFAAGAQAPDASELSQEELQSRFDAQMEEVKALGEARGLTLLTETGAPDEVEAGEPGGMTYVDFDDDIAVDLRIAFDFDSSALREDQKPKLAKLCEAMLASQVELFRVVGHTDAVGAEDYNQRLSLLRAEEVRRHLVSDCGIDSGRLQAMGVGETHLLDPADPEAEANRRVEFQALS